MSRKPESTRQTANRFFSALLGALGQDAKRKKRLATAPDDSDPPPDESHVRVADDETMHVVAPRPLVRRP